MSANYTNAGTPNIWIHHNSSIGALSRFNIETDLYISCLSSSSTELVAQGVNLATTPYNNKPIIASGSGSTGVFTCLNYTAIV